jgi:hypothetical protein
MYVLIRIDTTQVNLSHNGRLPQKTHLQHRLPHPLLADRRVLTHGEAARPSGQRLARVTTALSWPQILRHVREPEA